MKRGATKNLITKGLIIAMIVITSFASIAKAESLFMMSTSQNYYTEPKGLYSMVRARSVGDLVTIILEESLKLTDQMNYGSDRTSKTVDNFTTMLRKIIPCPWLYKDVNNFGGSNTVESTVDNSRNMAVADKLTVQVVQLLPNGNLVVQGKKTIINANERVDLLVSGVVDPRVIDELGQVSSKHVANLQFAFNGKGSTSRGNNEGIINRAVRYLF